MVKKTISKRTDRGSEQFLLRLPDGMRVRLAKVAEREGHTMSGVIVAALAMYFAKEDAAKQELLRVETAIRELTDQLASQHQTLELLRKIIQSPIAPKK
jgi:hypothetical protein